MINRLISLIFLLVTLSSCSLHRTSQSQDQSTDESNLVSVDHALNLARVSFVRGCLVHQKKPTYGKAISDCRLRAQEFIDSELLPIIKGKTYQIDSPNKDQ